MADPTTAAATGATSGVDVPHGFESEATARLAKAVDHMNRRACWYDKLRRLLIAASALLAAANVLCAAGRMQLDDPWCLLDETSAVVGGIAELGQDLLGSHLR